jgi:hypothetical protein
VIGLLRRRAPPQVPGPVRRLSPVRARALSGTPVLSELPLTSPKGDSDHDEKDDDEEPCHNSVHRGTETTIEWIARRGRKYVHVDILPQTPAVGGWNALFNPLTV